MNGLLSATTYYVRAYATNSAGTAYGNEINFITSPPIQPVLITEDISSITSNSAASGGNIIDDGGAAVTERGICWSTVSNPTTADSHIASGSGTGVYVSNITGLTRATTYYVRAYATNSVGTAYGGEKTFTTLPDLPILTTTAISSITSNSAASGGDITDAGGGTITERGVCWNTSPNPTIANSRITSGSGTGVYTSNITGLTRATTYYVRAYATNSAGTAYGNEINFITLPELPTVSTMEVRKITIMEAEVTGNISNDGGASITERGFCWSNTNPEPTISDTHLQVGSGDGFFIAMIAGLMEETNYNVRAYAINSQGISYGNSMPFMTLIRVIDDRDPGRQYSAIRIGAKVWMAENLKYLPAVSPPTIRSSSEAHYYVYEYVGSDINEARETMSYNEYGVLYNWTAAMNGSPASNLNPSGVQGVCPNGWHLPSEVEWQDLVMQYGGHPAAGSALKESGTLHWQAPNDGFNSSQFTALPGGYLNNDGNFSERGFKGKWHATNEKFDNPAETLHYYMSNDKSEVEFLFNTKEFGYSVRCVRDF